MTQKPSDADYAQSLDAAKDSAFFFVTLYQEAEHFDRSADEMEAAGFADVGVKYREIASKLREIAVSEVAQ
jgi:hypothetical protein